MIPGIVKLCESPSKAGGLLMINYRNVLEVPYNFQLKMVTIKQ
jgi:hypothetical protein